MQVVANDQQNDTNDIHHWILHACHFNDVPELATKIKFKFVKRLTRVFGRAWCQQRLIEISEPLWARASIKDRRQLIIHETCHIVATYKHGYNISHHGREWRTSMQAAGVEALRCHSVNRDGLRRKYVKYEIECSCGKVWVGHIKAAQVRKNELACARCKLDIKLTGNEYRET